MEIRAAQLPQHINPLAPLYWLSSDEPLLLQEGCDAIRTRAQSSNYERTIFHIDSNFEWSTFFNCVDNLSLFSNKQLIELRFAAKLNKEAQAALLRYCELPIVENCVLIISGKTEASTKKTQWYKTIEKAAICASFWPLDKQQLAPWLQQRAKHAGLNVSPDALALIVDHVEGNLLAANQAIEKLSLLFDKQTVDTSQVLQSIGADYRYDIFKLIDLCLTGNVVAVSKALTSLQQEGIEAILVLWAIARELRTILQIIETRRQGNSLDTALQKNGIWQNRRALFTQYFSRCKTKTVYEQLHLAAIIDRQIKGMHPGNPWENLLVLCLQFSGMKEIS